MLWLNLIHPVNNWLQCEQKANVSKYSFTWLYSEHCNLSKKEFISVAFYTN